MEEEEVWELGKELLGGGQARSNGTLGALLPALQVQGMLLLRLQQILLPQLAGPSQTRVPLYRWP